jgi:hypothetical protein
MPGTNTVQPNTIYIPPLQISVFSVESMPVPVQSVPKTCSRTHLGNFTEQLFMIDENKSTPAVYGVQLKPEQLTCVSCLHPNMAPAWCLSQQIGESTILPEHKCLLNKQKTNLIFLAPSMQVKVLFCSQSNVENNTNSMNTTSTNITEKTHMFTASLPLKHVLQQLMNSEGIVHQAITSEDENKVWQLHLSIADKTPPSAYECQ